MLSREVDELAEGLMSDLESWRAQSRTPEHKALAPALEVVAAQVTNQIGANYTPVAHVYNLPIVAS